MSQVSERFHPITSMTMAPQLRIYVPPHPLIKHWLGIARNKLTPSVLFRTAMTELGRWLAYEATREWLPLREAMVETPMGVAPATFIDPQVPIALIPVLRAGLSLLDGIQSVIPNCATYHLGLARNEETLEPECYLNKLPETIDPQTRIIISEPMMATGGSMMLTLQELTQRGADPSLIRIISIVVAPPALKKIGPDYPELQIYSAIVDETVNENGFIVPGLGDAGDRAFQTG